MKSTEQQHFKARKRAWEQLLTPRIDWESFKRIVNNSTSLESAVKRANLIRAKKLKRT